MTTKTKSCVPVCCVHPIDEEIESPRVTHEGKKYFITREQVVCCRCGASSWRDKK